MTRLHDDKCRFEFDRNVSKRPLQYITHTQHLNPSDNVDPLKFEGQHTVSTHVSPDAVPVHSDMRPTATNLNEIQLLQTDPFQIRPFEGSGKLLGRNDLMNVNSDMRGNASRVIPFGEGETVTVAYHQPEFLTIDPQIGAVLPDSWLVGGRSSRQDMRELYKQTCGTNK